MSYSLKQYPNKEYEFPPPPQWLTWIEELKYEYTSGKWVPLETGEGQVRHQSSLAKAKKYVGGWAQRTGAWYGAWSIYEWDPKKGKYVQRYSGQKGDVRSEHPLWQTRIKPGQIVRDVDEEEIAAVMASLMGE